MLKRPPRAEDDHKDSLVLSKNVRNSNFQAATLVNAINYSINAQKYANK